MRSSGSPRGTAGRRRPWPLLALLLGLALVSGHGAEAQTPDCAVLERLAGTWIGRGSLQRHLLSGTEPLRCRLDSDWKAAHAELISRWDCRGVDGDLTFAGALAETGSGSRVSGTLEASQGLEAGVLAGRCETDAVALDLSGWNPTTRDPVAASLTISLSEDDRTLTTTIEARDPDSGEWFTALTIRFVR